MIRGTKINPERDARGVLLECYWSGMGVRTPVKLSSDLLDLLVNLSCVCDVCGCSQLSCSHTEKASAVQLFASGKKHHQALHYPTHHSSQNPSFPLLPLPALLLPPPVSPSNRHHNTTHYFPRCFAHRFSFFYISSFYSIRSKNCNRTHEPA